MRSDGIIRVPGWRQVDAARGWYEATARCPTRESAEQMLERDPAAPQWVVKLAGGWTVRTAFGVWERATR